MAEQKLQKQNVGNAGEYYIVSRLSAMNLIEQFYEFNRGR